MHNPAETGHRPMSDNRRVVKTVTREMKEAAGSRFTVVLLGSRARLTHRPDSDIDVLLLPTWGPGEIADPGRQTEERIHEAARRAETLTGLVVDENVVDGRDSPTQFSVHRPTNIRLPTHRKITTSASAKRYASIMTALAAFCSRPSNDRKLLESVQVQTANDCLRLVATDRFLLGIVDLPVEDGIGDLLEKPVVFAASDIRRLGSALRGGKVYQAGLLIDRTDDGRVELASQRENTIVTSIPGAYFPNQSAVR